MMTATAEANRPIDLSPVFKNDPYYRIARSQEELDAIAEARRLPYDPTAKTYTSHEEIVAEVMAEIEAEKRLNLAERVMTNEV